MIFPEHDRPKRNAKTNDEDRRLRTRDRRAIGSRRRIQPIVVPLEDRTLLTATLITLSTSANSLTYGEMCTLFATVTTDPPGGTTPTGGTVSFLDGSKTIGKASLSDGTAMFATPTLPLGPNVMTAVYSGSGAFGSSDTTAFGPMINTVVPMEDAGAPVYSVAADSSGDIFVAVSDGFTSDVLLMNGYYPSVFAGG